MPLSLSITDVAGVPTGATATLAGTLGASVTVYAQRVDGMVGAGSWGAVGTRVGDGPLALSLAKGYWWLHALSGANLSPLSYLNVTDGLGAVQDRCRDAAIATLKLLDVPKINGRAFKQTVPDETGVMYPCWIVSVETTQETEHPGTNVLDEVGHPVRVAINDRHDGQFDHRLQPEYDLWRELGMHAFRNRPLAGVPESLYCKIEPFQIADANLPAYQHFVSGFVVRCHCREPRGLGV